MKAPLDLPALPRLAIPKPPETSAGSPPASATKWIRVLLVEDNPDDATLIELELQRGGFQSHFGIVETAAAAESLLLAEEWDVVISDHNLPTSSGEEVLTRLQETGLDIPFILVSGSVPDDVAVDAMREGASDYIMKDNLLRLPLAIDRELAAAKLRAIQADSERLARELAAARLKETINRARRFEVLHELAAAASGVLSESVITKLTIDRARELLQAESGVLRWFDQSTGKLVRARGDSRSRRRPAALGLNDGLMGTAFTLDKSVIENDYPNAGEGLVGQADGVKKLLAVPIRSGERAIGVLGVMRYTDLDFDEEDARFLELLAGLVGPAIGAARLHTQLTEADDRLRGIYEALACGVIVSRPDGTVLDVNEMARTIFGVRESVRLTATGRMKANYFDDQGLLLGDGNTPWSTLVEAADGRRMLTFGIKIDGRPMTWIVSRTVIATAADKSSLRVTSFVDVTPLKLAEVALANSEELFKNAFEGAPSGVSIVSPAGRILRTNGALARMLGYSSAEMLSLSIADIVHPDDLERRLDLGRRRLEEPGAPDTDKPSLFRNLRKDGTQIWVSVYVAAMRDAAGKLSTYVTQVFDVTTQLEADELAERNRVQLEQAQEIGSIGTWLIGLTDSDESMVFSPGQQKMFGYAEGEFSGRAKQLYEHIHPEDRERVSAVFAEARSGSDVDVRHRILRPDGSVRWVHSHGEVARDESGAPLHVLGITTDLTAQHEVEEAALKDRETLQTVLNRSPVILFAIDSEGRFTLAEGRGLGGFGLTSETARSLNTFELFAEVPEAAAHIRAGLAGESFAGEIELGRWGLSLDVQYGPILDGDNRVIGMSGIATDISGAVNAKRMREDSEVKARIAAMMNHEVRTPLNSVLGFAELLAAAKVGPLNPAQARYVTNIQSAGSHLLSLINESLDLAKLAAGQMEVHPQLLDLRALVEEAAGQVQPALEVRELSLETHCEPGLHVTADRRHLIQILYNLLSNAIKHSPKCASIQLRTSLGAGGVLVAVEDHGNGIPAADLERIFLEFVTLDSGVVGTGLGLPLSRQLAKLMKGNISVASEVGSGSTFTLALPLASVDSAELQVALS